ncbi:MAG TPA: AVAST type 1 anti-phage system protease Avs1b [Terrimicrobiaceae bacterium]
MCEKAKGHPLYLRYLIEYANHQAADEGLNDFPVLAGPIEEYYQSIWAKLLPDGDAVNLLALMARLRWGMTLSDFAKVLTPSEQTQFVSVMSRIRHLLAEEDNTRIYHASFSVFIIEQTAGIDAITYHRLAEFCRKEPGVYYCALNRIFHLLRAGDNDVFAACNQAWFDTAVTLGVEPDALIADVEEVLKRAAMEGSADEFFRLMLLAQRISFRYDTLFAQSARLIAEALIVLGRPSEALQHVLRFKTLIVGPDDALQISFLLHKNGYDEEALTLLDQVMKRIVRSYDVPMRLGHFLKLCSWRIETVFLVRLADGWNGMKQVMAVIEMARRACDEALQENPSERDMFLCPILAKSPVYFLTFRDEYADLDRIRTFLKEEKQPHVGFSPQFLQTHCIALLDFENTVDTYHLPKSRKALPKLFADLAELISSGEIEAPLASAVTDTLVRFGAPANIVELFGAKGGKQTPRPLKIKAKNGVDVNHKDLEECLCHWRVCAFLDASFHGPFAGIIVGTGWFESIEHVIGALYCCDGRARRAKADSDEAARIVCRDQLNAQVIEPLRFTLQQRAAWNDSYAIPENALPRVYRQLAELLSDCFPEQLPEWLDNLVASADGQWGMYSEGFRASAFYILKELTREKPSGALASRLLSLLHAWRDHVLRGVENRHELVPEILRMIPVFAHLGAKEEAEKLYQRLLSVSMGPTWYKEDQLGIMTEVLSSVAVSKEIEQRLPQVAGYLERVSGEMTFQRFVRAEKSTLLGQIARQGKFSAALSYFRRQCCGSTVELWAEAQQGPIDKVGLLKGNRFPGGALDDQAAVLALVRNSGTVSWALRWALLEIFHCGDNRHLTDYAEAFAKIANEVGAVPELVRRAEIVAKAETPSDARASFTSAFRRELKSELHPAFATVLVGLPPLKLPEPPEPQVNRNTDDDDADEGFFHPGVFGRQKALRNADKILEEAEREWSLGNRNAAKARAVKVLQTAQEGGWGIWGNLSAGARRAEEILTQQETSAENVIRYYAPLIEAERYVPKWVPAQHLIGKVGPMLTEAESQRLLDAVIDHTRLMVGDATQEIQAFDFLADDTPELSPDVEVFRFIVWLCNHPQRLRRDRAAAMLLWLVEQVPELFSEAVTTAFSMDEGYGPDVLCGVLDGASARDPAAIWDKIARVLDLTKVTQELRHVSRMVVLERLATRADKSGLLSAKSPLGLIKASFAGKRGTGGDPKLPIWAGHLAREWRQFMNLVDSESVAAWENELEQLCSPLSLTDALTLESAVLSSFRESQNRPLNRWESKLRHALNVALWPHVSHDGASVVEAALRSYNPSQPERTVQGMSNSFTDQLMAAIKSGDYSAVLGSKATVLLNYHDMVVKPNEEGASHVEVLCLLQPTSNQWDSFGPQLEQFFRSSELPVASTVRTPFETCCRLEPEVVFFGPFTPATSLSFFQNLVGAKDEDFVRQNWRYGRRNEVRGFGQPERGGCSLSVPRKALKLPPGFKLTWLVWIDGEVVAFVDEYNNRLL